jgi:hypothetical protein
MHHVYVKYLERKVDMGAVDTSLDWGVQAEGGLRTFIIIFDSVS